MIIKVLYPFSHSKQGFNLSASPKLPENFDFLFFFFCFLRYVFKEGDHET